jgi:hypothetical protein
MQFRHVFHCPGRAFLKGWFALKCGISLALGQSDAASVALLRTKLTPDWLCNRSAAIPKTKSIPIADLTLVSIKSIQF